MPLYDEHHGGAVVPRFNERRRAPACLCFSGLISIEFDRVTNLSSGAASGISRKSRNHMASIEDQALTLIKLASLKKVDAVDYSRIEAELRSDLRIVLRESAARLKYPGVLDRARARIEMEVGLEVCDELLIDIRTGVFEIGDDGRLKREGKDCDGGFSGYALGLLKSCMDGRVNINGLALEAIRVGCNNGEWDNLFNLMNNGLFRKARHRLCNYSEDEWNDVIADTWKTVIEQINSGKLSVKEQGNMLYLEYRGERHQGGFAAHCYGILGNNIKRVWRAAAHTPIPLDEEPPDEAADAGIGDCISFCISLIEIENHKVALGAWYNWLKYESYLSGKFSRSYDFIKLQLRAAGLETDNENTIASWISRGKNRFKKLYAIHCQ
jgi:hypothetical protein